MHLLNSQRVLNVDNYMTWVKVPIMDQRVMHFQFHFNTVAIMCDREQILHQDINNEQQKTLLWTIISWLSVL